MSDEFSRYRCDMSSDNDDGGGGGGGGGGSGDNGTGANLVDMADSGMDLTGYLETYMGQRAAQSTGGHGASSGGVVENGGTANVYTELQRREQDLMLAAQLGRALLASNAELQHRNQRIAEEFGDRIQWLERERAGLRAKLDAVEQDYDCQMRELQSDVLRLREELRRQQLGRVELERERAAQAAALGRANERLAEESRQRRQAEQRAASQSAELQAELRARRAAMQEHLAQLAQLKEQLHSLHAQKAELECRLSQVAEERDALLSAAEDQQLAISRMQRRDQEQGDIIAEQEARIHDLQATAACLHRQVEALAPQAARSDTLMVLEAPPAGGESLFSELGGDAQQLFGWRQGVGDGDNCVEEDEEVEEILEEEGDTDDGVEVEEGSAGFGAVASAPAAPSRPNTLYAAPAGLSGAAAAGAGAIEEYDDDDVEIDDEVYLRSTLSDLSSPPYLPHDDEYEYDYEGDYAVGAAGGIGPVEMDEMRGEVLEVYYQLRGMCADLGRRRGGGAGGSQPGKTPDELAMVEMDFRLGSLRQVLGELRGLIGDIGGLREGAAETAASSRVQAQVVESLQEQVRQKDRELEAKSTELQRLGQELQHVQLNIQQQESLILQDSADAGAQHELQEAAQRRSGLQEQLARMNAEVARLNGELNRTAEERGELSDQIGLWSDAAGLCSLAEPESSDLSQSLASAARSSPANHNGPPAKK
ncbi:hypothetical protein BOX15_Mlig034394g3 [Macrostomum lignano]|uniref:HAP1 N-terminal domain-containing protein n=1 Tax=Macrostomum lignano TaxID=282301 RepID=A0A267GUI8_9PLAT|nr:hypothetical protein BOX15_Mlig034394g3 [Macrostomum lignano]